MRRLASGVVLAWICAVVLPATAFAQASGIAGVVRDTSGAVMPGVTVEASSPALIERVRTVTTDTQGQYKIVDLRPGDLHRHVHAARLLDRQARRDRAAGHLHRDGQRRPARRRARGNRHRDRRQPDRRHPERAQAAGRQQGHDRRDADVEELVHDRRDDGRRQQQPERRRRLGRRAPESAEGARRLVQRPAGAARRDHERQHGVQLLVHRPLDQRRRRRRS